MSRQRRLAVAALSGLALVLLAACSADDDGPDVPVPVATVATVADCQSPQILASLGLTPVSGLPATVSSSATPHPDAPPVGAVPASFVATSVVECTRAGSLVDAAGTWTSVRAKRLDGDTGALVKALALPSADESDGAGCDVPPMQLWLVDALGHAIRAWVPVRSCGVGPRDEVIDALADLTVIDTATYPVGLVQPAPTP